MSLLSKLGKFGDEYEQTIAIAEFINLFRLYGAGSIGRDDFAVDFNLSAAEMAELDLILSQYAAKDTAVAKSRFVDDAKAAFEMAELRNSRYNSLDKLRSAIEAL